MLPIRILLAATVVTVAAVLASAPLGAQERERPRVGQPAPAVALPTLAGDTVDLAEYIGQTPILIQFFAAWCGQCREQMPSLRSAMARYGRQVKFIGVAVSASQSVERARNYVEAHGFTHEILYDARGEAVERYAVPTTSYVVVIDKSGRIVYTGWGGSLDFSAAARKAL